MGLLACLLVWATLAAAPARGASDPAPGVARLSFIQSGSVVVTHDGAAAADGTVNAPLVPGDVLATADASTRAEIQLDGFTSVRLGGGVRARIVSNDARRPRQISVTAGLVELAVLRGSDLATEIVAPLVTLRTHYAGDYRISVETDGATSVTVRSGQTDVVTPRRTYTVVTGQTLIARGDAADPSVVFAKAIPRDSFDDFNGDRDRTLLGALNGDTHVPASIAGYDDLDAYGSWTGVDSYGQAWVPDQSAGWAPYRDGQWSYAGAYGLTWVGNEPWGWVPYHYGRWIYARNRWCWYPPSLSAVPIWAPALVGFFGYGTGPFGYSGLGWVPLAPGEAYYPAYPWYWYAGIPAVPRHSYPVPAPPPKRVRHRGPPVRMYPLATAFRNAQFGGASAVGAVAID
ncbi:MAG: DUF6600 domain-containing protein, partial [Candidatus Tumulicola sp.]